MLRQSEMVAFSCLSPLLVTVTSTFLSSTLQQKMEILIKEENLTVSKIITPETVDEALDAAIDILTRIFGEIAVENALKRLE
jgi:hypothetical protein